MLKKVSKYLLQLKTFRVSSVERVINTFKQYFFDEDSYFAVFYAYKKEYIIVLKFYGSALWIFIFISFSIWRRGGPKYFLLKNMDLLYAKETH